MPAVTDKKETHVTRATATFSHRELLGVLGREAMDAMGLSGYRGLTLPQGTTVKLRLVEGTRDSGAYKSGEFTAYVDIEIDHMPCAAKEPPRD